MGHAIKELVDEALKSAGVHSLKCEDLICSQGLAKAMEYAESMGVKPAQCSQVLKPLTQMYRELKQLGCLEKLSGDPGA